MCNQNQIKDIKVMSDEEKQNYLLDRLSLYDVDINVLTKQELEWVHRELFGEEKVADKESFFFIGNIGKLHNRMYRRNPKSTPIEKRDSKTTTRVQKGRKCPSLFDIGVEVGDILTCVYDENIQYEVDEQGLTENSSLADITAEALEGVPYVDMWEEWTCNGIYLSDLYDKWAEKKCTNETKVITAKPSTEKGKKKCKALRELRMKIAKANNIDYHPAECHHEGDCAGTCPLCEQELAELTKKLRERQDKGENVELKDIAKDEKFFDIALEEGVTVSEELADGMVILSEIDETDTLMGEMPMINVLDKNVKAKKR